LAQVNLFHFTIFVLLLSDGVRCKNCIAYSERKTFEWFSCFDCFILLYLHTCTN